ncbi:hypothetical protein TNCV_1046391 [Trichonephila clavipes]|nr:hypothetical protein TNCV_1046391 [Trichonephila clavipes]
MLPSSLFVKIQEAGINKYLFCCFANRESYRSSLPLVHHHLGYFMTEAPGPLAFLKSSWAGEINFRRTFPIQLLITIRNKDKDGQECLFNPASQKQKGLWRLLEQEVFCRRINLAS